MNPPKKQLYSPPETRGARDRLVNLTREKPYNSLVPTETTPRYSLVHRLRHLVKVLVIHPLVLLARRRACRIIIMLARIFVQVIYHHVYQTVIYIVTHKVSTKQKVLLPFDKIKYLYSIYLLHHKYNVYFI